MNTNPIPSDFRPSPALLASAALALILLGVAPVRAASWEGTDDFSSGISLANWKDYQQYVGQMIVVGTNGHASFLVPVSATTEQNAFIVWRGTPTAAEDWTVDITGHNNAFHPSCQLQLAVLNTEAWKSGAVDGFVVGMKNDLSVGAVGTSWWHYPGGWTPRVRLGTTSTDFKLRLVYHSTTQTIEAWYDPTASGLGWTQLDSMTLNDMSPGMTATNTFSFAILGNTDYGPIAEEIWADNFRICKDTVAPYAFTNFVGLPGVSGSNDGTTGTARFNVPTRPAMDAVGNLFVADMYNHTIRKITPAGAVTTLAGMAGIAGSANGTGSAARFNQPRAVALDATGNIFVPDWGNHTIRKVTPAGVVTTLAGSPGNAGWVDATGSAARFNMPECVTVDSNSNIFVAERDNFVIRKVTPAGVVTTLAGNHGVRGWADGTGSAALFNDPSGIAVDSAGNLFVGDRGNDAIRKVTQAGEVTTLAGSPGNSGWADGVRGAARFYRPSGVAVDNLGNVFVTEERNHTIRKVTYTGAVTTIGGLAGVTGTNDGVGSDARFNTPAGAAVDASGVLYVSDAVNHRITRGVPYVLPFQTIFDPFTNSANWGPPINFSPDSDIFVANEVMNYTCTSTAQGGGAIPRNTPILPTTQDWSMEVDVHLDPFSLTTQEQFSDLFLGFGKTGDWVNTHVMFEFGRGLWGSHNGYYIGDDVRINGTNAPTLFNVWNISITSSLSALRMDYDAANRTITYYWDANAATGGYNWTAQATASLASGTYNLNLSSADTLTVLLVGSSEFQTVGPGQAYFDNLRITIGQPSTPPPPFTWITNNGTITITGYTGPGGAVVIPSTIYGLPVTTIGTLAFDGSALTNVTIPNTVTTIEHWAFARCFGLSSATIGNSVINIGQYAFYHCSGLSSVTIPSSVTNIGDFAFLVCTNLTAITVDPLNPVYRSADGVLFNQVLGTLIACPGGKTGAYAVPNSVTNIGQYAFHYCPSLTSVTIPSGVTSIGSCAFFVCTSMTAITVDAQNQAYSSLEGVLFNKARTTLIACPGGKSGAYAVPNSVTTVGVFAFPYCNSLTSVVIPQNVTRIREYAFYECTSLTNVSIPDSVTRIATFTFYHCASLANVAIPNTVITIERAAFAACGNLATITIPDSVTNLGDGAFASCSALTGVYCGGNAPGYGSDVFSSANNATVYYLPGTTGWGPTFGGRPTAPWVLPYPVILGNSSYFGVQTNAFGFLISWASNATVVVDASPDLLNPVWSPVSTNTLVNGTSYFTDPHWINYPARFYRLRSP